MRGACLCGAVGFEAEPSERHSHACHCTMCRRWSGSAFVGVEVRPDALRLHGEEAVASFRSSEWAERAWCRTCGSHLWYRVTAPGPMAGVRHMPLGLFEEPDAFPLTSEIYIDRKPASFAFAGEHERRTEAEVEAAFSGAEGGA